MTKKEALLNLNILRDIQSEGSRMRIAIEIAIKSLNGEKIIWTEEKNEKGEQ